MDIETSEQLAFIPEQVESILMTVVDGILRTEVYIEEKVRGIASCCSAFGPRFKLKHYFGRRDLGLFVALARSSLAIYWRIACTPHVLFTADAVTLWGTPATSMACVPGLSQHIVHGEPTT